MVRTVQPLMCSCFTNGVTTPFAHSKPNSSLSLHTQPLAVHLNPRGVLEKCSHSAFRSVTSLAEFATAFARISCSCAAQSFLEYSSLGHVQLPSLQAIQQIIQHHHRLQPLRLSTPSWIMAGLSIGLLPSNTSAPNMK